MKMILMQTPFGEIGVNPDHIEAITPHGNAAIIHFVSKETLTISLSLPEAIMLINTKGAPVWRDRYQPEAEDLPTTQLS
jgi:hypothetical protein